MLNKSPNECSGVVGTAVSNLALYRDPVVAMNTEKSDFTISDLMNYDSPISLYLVVSPTDINRVRPLLRLILNLIISRLCERMALVTAQEGRRVLDRLVGYQVSPPLSRLLGGKNSAGRVQSPALRLVVDREREIRAFTVTTHFGVDLIFDAIENVSAGWKATWKPDAWLEPGQRYILDKDLATRVSGIRKVSVASCTEQEVRKAPPPPFTTSSLQQAASIALKLSPKETMLCLLSF